MPKVLVVGGGYAGFYTAWHLEKKLRPDEAEIVVVDPRPYMTYQPFLPEVTAGSVEPRHAAVCLCLPRPAGRRRGADPARHGDGVIRQLPSGGFVEARTPLPVTHPALRSSHVPRR